MPTNLPAELSSACSTLFGPDITPTPAFLSRLQPGALKAAFRKKALDSHPDRLQFLQTSGRNLHNEFISVTEAYAVLLRYINNRPKGFFVEARCWTTPQDKKRPSQAASAHPCARPLHPYSRHRDSEKPQQRPSGRHDFFHSGQIPGKKLLFCEFLYYSGVISWYTLIDAVTWQRTQRPPLEQLAIDKGLLTMAEVMQLLSARPWDTPFGEFALQQGYLDPDTLKTLLDHQRRLHQPIGSFFVRQKLFTLQEIFHLLSRHMAHNRNIAE